jgi:hypothetical protein
MSKRSFPYDILLDLKRRRLEQLKESKFNSSGCSVKSFKELPIHLIQELYCCITGKFCRGESSRSIKLYNQTILEWLTTIQYSGISAHVSENIRNHLSVDEIAKLRLQDLLSDDVITETTSNGIILGVQTCK